MRPRAGDPRPLGELGAGGALALDRPQGEVLGDGQRRLVLGQQTLDPARRQGRGGGQGLRGVCVGSGAGRSGLLPAGAVAVLGRCQRLFARWGDGTVFVARLLPLARSFVSLPAGHLRVRLSSFVALTVAGCAIWSLAFVLAGALAGGAWASVADVAGRASAAVAVLVLLACASRLRSW